MPNTKKGLLPWNHVIARMERSRSYWIITAGPDGQPHAVPTWGVWLDDTRNSIFGAIGSEARRGRALRPVRSCT